MSPAPARTSVEEIVAAGRELLDAGGVDAVTMQGVAERVGVRGPSLYKRIPSRAALLSAIAADVLLDLGARLAPRAAGPDPEAALADVSRAFRSFAHAHPHAYQLAWSGDAQGEGVAEASAVASQPVLQLMTRLVGPDRALDAARTVTAFAHGFVSMELAGAFRLGGDVEEAFDHGVGILREGLTRRPAPPPRRGARGR